MIAIKKNYACLFILSLLIYACKNKTEINDQFHFTLMEPGETNIYFNNKITETDSINVFNNEYMYNGSGVGIGDFNNDGLQDVFFCGSMVSSKLFLNKGNFEFEDITVKAGLETNRWCTGVSVADVNNDGFMDIYVSVSHTPDTLKRKNLLFVNDGKLHFTEQAAAYGLADAGCATQTTFFDYDKDGDLDVYVLNHRLYSHTANTIQPKDSSGKSPAQDKLYRNDGVPNGGKHPVFTDVTIAAGVKEDGYGLGIVVTDVNNDNWPDIYIANDYIANDIIWLNNKNGTFSNISKLSLKHQSYNSMGVDAADINNDLLPDIASLDMLPENSQRKKMMANSTTQEKFDMALRVGYENSYVRNMLQLNNGNRSINDQPVPFYSEIGELAGVFETDWSWSVLMADYDNDGWKDIHITNGLARDVTNNDYLAFRNIQNQTSTYTFGDKKAVKALSEQNFKKLRNALDEYGEVKMDNYLFHNNGNLTFSDISAQSGIKMPSISNGAAYADLDNDGDLDLVVNNMNQESFVWRNELRRTIKDSTQNFIELQLKGPAGNSIGIGSKVMLYTRGMKQLAEQSPVRGFSSSVDNRIFFGVGNAAVIDSILIRWPDDKEQLMQNIKTNQLLTVKYSDAKPAFKTDSIVNTKNIFADITTVSGIDFKHTETPNFDFGYHQPLSQRYSQLGPCIATADVNGDGFTDFFVGGAANQPGKIFIQKAGGSFTSADIEKAAKPGEDLTAIFFDADADKDADLLVTGGSFEFKVPAYNLPRLYLNDGKGNFSLDAQALPSITDLTDAAVVGDYDGDGDDDIFIAGRMVPDKYPQSPRSYILQNNKGKFTDVTAIVCSVLQTPGMVTDALFTDFDNDKKLDLIICGEWMPVRFFKNENGKLAEVTAATSLTEMNGLWRSLQQVDIDKDGDMDYVAGNMGLNNRYHISAKQPMMLYSKDIDKNGFIELVPAFYIKSDKGETNLYPALDRTQLGDQAPMLKKKYLQHSDYSKIDMQKLKSDFGSDGWNELKCETSASVWIENLGGGKFKSHELPLQAQFAPINSIVATDADTDGNIDLIVAGNEYQAEVNIGRYDASYGLLLKGDGKGNFKSVDPVTSGLIIDGDVKDMKMVNTAKGKLLLAAPNDSKLKVFSVN